MKEISWKKNLFAVWVSQLLSLAGFAGIMPFMPLFMREKFGITDEKQLGMWTAAFMFSSMISFTVAQPFWGFVSDKYGRKLMLIRSYFAAGILFPLMCCMPTIGWLLAMRFICSFFTGTVAAAQTLIATCTPQEHQGFAQGLLSSAIWTGNMIGFMAGAMIVHWLGFNGGFIFCGILYLIGGFLTVFLVRENFTPPVKQAKDAAKPKTSFWKEIPHPVFMIMLLFLFLGLARRFDDSYISIMVSLVGGDERAVFHTGVVSAVAAAGGFLSSIFIGKLCDRFSPEKVAIPAILISSFTMFLQFISHSLFMLGGARFVHFTAAGGLDPAFLTLLARITPADKVGSYFGVTGSFRIFGILLGTVISGSVAGLFGVRAIFLGSTLLFLLLLPFLFFVIRAQKQAKLKDQSSQAI